VIHRNRDGTQRGVDVSARGLASFMIIQLKLQLLGHSPTAHRRHVLHAHMSCPWLGSQGCLPPELLIWSAQMHAFTHCYILLGCRGCQGSAHLRVLLALRHHVKKEGVDSALPVGSQHVICVSCCTRTQARRQANLGMRAGAASLAVCPTGRVVKQGEGAERCNGPRAGKGGSRLCCSGRPPPVCSCFHF
jgi:hypothetical protein